jgi:CRP/FNR family cyclic AMP-dependent transcriptional regulator
MAQLLRVNTQSSPQETSANICMCLKTQQRAFGVGIAISQDRHHIGGFQMSKCLSCPEVGKHAFCKLGPESRAFLESNSLTTDYSRGSTLFREGDRSNGVFVMCSGKVKVSATSRDGKTMILRIADAGDVLGMSAALTKGEYEVTAEALEPCRVRVLHLKHLTTMLQNYGDASLGAANALAEDYRAAFDEARLIALPASPAGRVARLILDWAEDARSRSNSLITMSLTHEEVASMTATTRETVTRTLGRFRKDKIISTHGVVLTVLQPKALERLCAC